jgi:PAS domain S-box-containing protein
MTFPYLKSCHRPGEGINLFHVWACLIILVALFSLCHFGIVAAKETPPPKVLILNSYHPGYTWSEDEEAGVLQELRRGYPDVDPAIEYLDTKRFPADEHLQKIKDYLVSKYRGHKFDLVVALDNPALMMLLKYRSELFPGTPIVFGGINDFQPAMLAGQAQVTGDAEVLDVEGTLKMALALHPETTKILVVTDGTMTGRAARREVDEVLPRLPAGVQVEFAPPATMAELVDRIKRLPPTAIVFITGFATDAAGQTFSLAEGARRLTEAAKIPVYIVHGGRLGYGPVGGMLLEGREEGRQAGEIALQVLAGKDPSHIPVDTKGHARPMFDYRQLTRFNIPEADLPAGSIIINRPSSFYEIHKSLMWAISGVVLGLGLVVLVLGVNIARRRRAEASLRESEARFRSLVENVDLGIALIGPDYRIIMTNPAQGKFFRKSASTLAGQECFREFEKRDAVCSHCPGTIAMATGKKTEIEVQGVRDDGNVITSRVQAFPQFAPNGRIDGFIEVAEDITQKVQVAKALETERLILRDILEATLAGYWDWDIPNNREYLSPTLKKMFGYEDHELPNSPETWKSLIFPEDLPGVLDIFQKHVQSRGAVPYYREIRYRHKDGSAVWVICAGRVIEWDAAGNALRMVGCHVDITERKLAEEALAEETIRRRILMDQSSDGIVVLDQNGKVFEANQRYAEMLGYSAEEVTQLYVWDWDGQWTRPELLEQIRRVDATGAHFETRHRRKDGTFLEVEISTNGVVLRGQKLVFCVCRDITERKQADRELRDALERERFLANIIRRSSQAMGVGYPDGRLGFCNEAFFDLTGYHAEELQDVDWNKNLTPVEWREMEATKLRELTVTKQPVVYEKEYIRKDGSRVPVELLVDAEFDAEGKPKYYFAFIEDITERKTGEEALRKSEEKFRLAFEKAPIGIMRYDQTSTITECNEKLTEIIGASKEKLLGFNMIRQFQDDRMREAMTASLNGEMGYYEGDYLSVTGGKLTSIRQIFEPIFSPEGVMSGGIAIVEDITKRKRAEESLRESENRFRHISSTISDISYSCTNAPDGSFFIDWMVGAAENITGYSVEEIKAQRCWRFLVIEEDLPLFEKHVTSLVAGSSDSCELRIRHKNGKIVWVASFAECVKEPGPSERIYLYGGLVDINDRKQAEEEIHQKSEQLRALAARSSEIQEIERQNLARELHDQVCQNLASINIVLETLMIRARREPLDHLLSRLADLGAVAEQTGEITRVIMEGLRPTVLDHYGLMGGLRQLGEQFSQRTGIDIVVQGDEADSRLTPKVELGLFRIAQEALNNVAKHAQASHVVVTEELDKDTIRLIISDNGTGFDSNAVTKPKEGRGWGLMTMTERAIAFGGHCRIESQLGQGTRVIVKVSR